MPPRIVLCTTDPTAWSTLHRALAANGIRLEKVERLEDAAKHGGPAAEVHVAVVDDRFLTVLNEVESSLRRFSPAFRNTVFMTLGEALTARWIGLLDQDFAAEPLLMWMARERSAPRPAAAWH